MSGFASVVASARMSSWELTRPEMMMRPLTWDQWWLREFILHRERFVDAAGEAETLKRNATDPK